MGFKIQSKKYYLVVEEYADNGCSLLAKRKQIEISEEDYLIAFSNLCLRKDLEWGRIDGQIYNGKNTRGNKLKYSSRIKGCKSNTLNGCKQRRNRNAGLPTQSFQTNYRKIKKMIRG